MVNAATDEIIENVLGVEMSITPFEAEAVLLIKDFELDLNDIQAEEVKIDNTARDDRGAGNPED